MRTISLLLVLACVVSACGRRVHDIPEAFQWERELSPGTTIHLRTLMGQIDVTGAEGHAAHVTGSMHWVGRKSPIHFVSTQEGADVYVCALWSSRTDCSGGDDFAGSRRSWLDMFSLFKRRSGEGTASLHVALPAGVKVDARATNGTISVHNATAGVTARAVNGAITVERSSGPVEAHATNANIHVAIDSLGPADDVVLQTVNGNMTAVLPADLEGDVELSTVNGRIRTDFPITTSGHVSNRQVHGRIGNSSREVHVRTINGNVSLLSKEGESSSEADPPAHVRPLKSSKKTWALPD